MGLLAHAKLHFGYLVLTLGLGEKIPIDILKNDESVLVATIQYNIAKIHIKVLKAIKLAECIKNDS